jgi:hypothetical protein
MKQPIKVNKEKKKKKILFVDEEPKLQRVFPPNVLYPQLACPVPPDNDRD